MSIALHVRDHDEFHRAAFHMAIAGGLAGLAGHVASLIFGLGSPTAPLPLAGLAAATAFGAASPDARLAASELAELALFAGAAAIALALAASGRVGSSFGAGAFALLFAVWLARGMTGGRRVAALLCGGVTTLASLYVLSSLVAISPAPAWLNAAGGGVGFAVVGALGVLPRHLELRRDPVEAAWTRSHELLRAEHRELAERSVEVWRSSREALEVGSPVRGAIEAAVLRLLALAERWHAADAAGRGALDRQTVTTRLDELDRKLTETSDEIARAQYDQARRELEAQRRHAEAIAATGERALARIHRYVAAVERLRFAAVNHRSADALRISRDDVQPILDDLEELGGEIDCANEALCEADHMLEAERGER